MKVPSVQNQMMEMNARAAQAKETSPVGNACAMTALMKIHWECALIAIQLGIFTNDVNKIIKVKHVMMDQILIANPAQAKETSPVANACAMMGLMKIHWECALIAIQLGIFTNDVNKIIKVKHVMMDQILIANPAQAKETSPVANACAMMGLMKIY